MQEKFGSGLGVSGGAKSLGLELQASGRDHETVFHKRLRGGRTVHDDEYSREEQEVTRKHDGQKEVGKANT